MLSAQASNPAASREALNLARNLRKRRRTRDVSTHVAKHFTTTRPAHRRVAIIILRRFIFPAAATKRQRRIARLAACRVRIAAALSPLTAPSSTARVHSRKHRVLTARAFCMRIAFANT